MKFQRNKGKLKQNKLAKLHNRKVWMNIGKQQAKREFGDILPRLKPWASQR